MTTLVHSPIIAMEVMAHEAVKILIQTLNDELPVQEAFFATLDEELAELRGVPYEPYTLEEVPTKNFHLGFQPSLIKAPLEEYPNVSVMTDRAGQGSFDNIDQMDSYSLQLLIELLVKSENDAEVNARALRTAEAVNVCMMSNDTLNGVVAGFDGPPTVQAGEVFYRKAETSYGEEIAMQGVRLEYAVTKEAAKPYGSFARPAGSAPSLLAAANIDQA